MITLASLLALATFGAACSTLSSSAASYSPGRTMSLSWTSMGLDIDRGEKAHFRGGQVDVGPPFCEGFGPTGTFIVGSGRRNSRATDDQKGPESNLQHDADSGRRREQRAQHLTNGGSRRCANAVSGGAEKEGMLPVGTYPTEPARSEIFSNRAASFTKAGGPVPVVTSGRPRCWSAVTGPDASGFSLCWQPGCCGPVQALLCRFPGVQSHADQVS